MARGGPRRYHRPERAEWETQRHPHEPDGMTYEQIARVLGVSRQAVQQIEYRALVKLRRMCGVEGL